MSDWADDAAEKLAETWCTGHVALVDVVAAELRAAEERGRRRGVELLGRMREALQAEHAEVLANTTNHDDGEPCYVCALLSECDAALAPRDSGKGCNCALRYGAGSGHAIGCKATTP